MSSRSNQMDDTLGDELLPSLTRGTVWIVVQLAPIVLMLFSVPLWARSPEPRERLIPAALLLAQLLEPALLFPWMLDRRGSIVFAVGVAVTMQLLASMAADEPISQWLIRSAIITGWLAIGTVAARQIRHPIWTSSARVILSMVAIVFSIIRVM